MEFRQFFKTFTLENGAPMLVWIEPEGDESSLHIAMYPEDLGLVDLKMTGPAEGMEKAFDLFEQANAQKVYDEQIGSMLAAVLGDGESEEDEGYRCVSGHDLCSVSTPGPDCPYCERK